MNQPNNLIEKLADDYINLMVNKYQEIQHMSLRDKALLVVAEILDKMEEYKKKVGNE
jgi:hypothetical protein